MTGAALAKKISSALKKVQACDEDVYLKSTSTTGGNPAIPGSGTHTSTTTKIDPRPVLSQISMLEVQDSNGLLLLGDVSFLIDNSVSEETLNSSSVLKGTTVYRIIKIDPTYFNGVIVAFKIYCRRMGS